MPGHNFFLCFTLIFLAVFRSFAQSSDIVVTTTVDVVNGDVTSPAKLIAQPGPDGVSLREAIEAANNASGPHVIRIDQTLAGQTIALYDFLEITQDGVTLIGLTNETGQPDITLDANTVPAMSSSLYVHASNIIIKDFRFIGQRYDGLSIHAGRCEWRSIMPMHIRNITIENNVFGDSTTSIASGAAIRIFMEPESGSIDAILEKVIVTRNTIFSYPDGMGINVQANGTNCVIRDVLIQDNTFFKMTCAIDVTTAAGSQNRVIGTRIIGNRFLDSYPQPTVLIAHMVDPRPNFGNIIDSTFVLNNIFSKTSGITIVGGQSNSSRNIIANTHIVNNLLVGESGIWIVGGKMGNSDDNLVDGVTIVNNTIITKYPAVEVWSNLDNAAGNTITGLKLSNNIFTNLCLKGDMTPDQISHCFASDSVIARQNNNILADPLFVDSAEGDFHLQFNSPAIDAGTFENAPLVDFDCMERIGVPDIGAFEFGNRPVARLTLNTSGTGSGTIYTNPSGNDCGGCVSWGFYPGTEVKLLAAADEGSIFVGWSGDIDCTDGIVAMTTDKNCTGTFNTVPTDVEIQQSEIWFSNELKPNYPNPFNPGTIISFHIVKSGPVTLKLFDLLGRQLAVIVDQELTAGQYEIKFNSTGLAIGIYFCCLQTRDFVKAIKLILQK